MEGTKLTTTTDLLAKIGDLLILDIQMMQKIEDAREELFKEVLKLWRTDKKKYESLLEAHIKLDNLLEEYMGEETDDDEETTDEIDEGEYDDFFGLQD